MPKGPKPRCGCGRPGGHLGRCAARRAGRARVERSRLVAAIEELHLAAIAFEHQREAWITRGRPLADLEPLTEDGTPATPAPG